MDCDHETCEDIACWCVCHHEEPYEYYGEDGGDG